MNGERLAQQLHVRAGGSARRRQVDAVDQQHAAVAVHGNAVDLRVVVGRGGSGGIPGGREYGGGAKLVLEGHFEAPFEKMSPCFAARETATGNSAVSGITS